MILPKQWQQQQKTGQSWSTSFCRHTYVHGYTCMPFIVILHSLAFVLAFFLLLPFERFVFAFQCAPFACHYPRKYIRTKTLAMPSTTYLTILLILVLFFFSLSFSLCEYRHLRFCLPRIFNSYFFPSCFCSAITGLPYLNWQENHAYMNRSLLLPFSLIQITYCATVCVRCK